jgi:hypothetical protein
MRKPILALALATLAVAGVARAEQAAEEIKPEQIQQYAQLALMQLQAQFPNPPVKVDYQVEKAKGFHVAKSLAVLTIPDKALTADVVAKADEKGTPVGIFVTTLLCPENKGEVIKGDKVAVADLGVVKVPVFFLSVKSKGDERILSLYSKGADSLMEVPLKKQTGDASVPLGMKLTDVDLEKKSVNLTLSLNGSYEGTLKLAYVEL